MGARDAVLPEPLNAELTHTQKHRCPVLGTGHAELTHTQQHRCPVPGTGHAELTHTQEHRCPVPGTGHAELTHAQRHRCPVLGTGLRPSLCTVPTTCSVSLFCLPFRIYISFEAQEECHFLHGVFPDLFIQIDCPFHCTHQCVTL